MKKVDFLRLNNPFPLGFAIRAVNKLKLKANSLVRQASLSSARQLARTGPCDRSASLDVRATGTLRRALRLLVWPT
jgi:hypothetical protein